MKKITLLLFLLLGSFSFGQINILTTDFMADGFDFSQLYTDNEVIGTLTSIDINATLAASMNLTFANDLTILITANSNINSAGILQAGGYSNLFAAERISWTTGDTDVVGTVLSESATLGTPLDFDANPTYNIWLGNGYGGGGTSGTWDNIDIVLHGISEAALSTSSQDEYAFSIYPNPANDFISISNRDTSLEINRIGIVDVNGRAIRTIVLGNASNNSLINVSDLSSGIYMFVISSNKGTIVKKFVKQ